MTEVTARAPIARRTIWLVGTLRDAIVGTLLCTSPLTSIIALGWITRRMGETVHRRWRKDSDHAGWLFGPRDRGWITWGIGGFAANIRVGVTTVIGLATLTLPFTILWLGAWWAGWENSFNKGYEQAAVGPSVWFLGAAISLPLLAHLPFALAHAAAENRISAFFEWRRISSVVSSAGWRVAMLAIISVASSVPLFGMRAIPVFIENLVPTFGEMSPDAQSQIAQRFELFGAALAFVIVSLLRHRAAAIYAIAAPRAAAGRHAKLWTEHAIQRVEPEGRTPSRFVATFWIVAASAIWFGLPALIVMGQFMNYEPALWLTHPLFLLPWVG